MTEVETLIEAVKEGDVARVKAIVGETPSLASGRVASGESPVMAAVYRGHHQVIAVLLDAGAEVDVFAAAATGRTDDLRRGLDVTGAVGAYAYDGWTPLHLAAFFGHLDCARLLLDAGANVNAVSVNSLRNTPLHAAAAAKYTDVALLLIERGVDGDPTDAGGYTALQIAEQNGLAEVASALRGRRQIP